EWVGAVRPETKLELEQQFVVLLPFCKLGEAILPANLAEFARPVGEQRGKTVIGQIRPAGAAGTVIAPSDRPAPVEAIIARSVEAKRALLHGQLVAAAPDKFRAADEVVIDR